MRRFPRNGIGTLTRCVALLVLASILPGQGALANGASAAANFFANLRRLGYDTKLEASSTADERTLVDGLYRLEDRSSGELVGLITESGDILGDSTGWRWITAQEPRPLSAQEAARLRAEVIDSIQWQKLVKVAYGDGGGRRIVLLSAVNCPFCARMEDSLARHAGSIDTTFYVLPMSLSRSITTDDGRASWRKAVNLWCAPDGATAWRHYWATHQVTERTGCALDEVAVFRTARNFSTVLSSIGVHVRGTPELIREDGSVLGFPPEPDAHFFRDVLGSKGLNKLEPSPPDAGHRRWLDATH
ncbi:MAG TPA: thioredoxin fold domain-containing protein [Burkholderiaceae bacterium]|nr:thioredoxin fold domain-containing protein [Burkholderiaceae bacterium]